MADDLGQLLGYDAGPDKAAPKTAAPQTARPQAQPGGNSYPGIRPGQDSADGQDLGKLLGYSDEQPAAPVARPVGPVLPSQTVPTPDQVDADTARVAQITIGAMESPTLLQRILGPIMGNVQTGDTALGRALGRGVEGVNNPDSKQNAPLLRFEGAIPDVKPGITTGVAKFATGLTAPENVELMAATGGAGGVVGRLISAGFAGKMLLDAYRQVPEFRQAVKNKDFGKAKELAAQFVLTGVMAGAATRHALKTEPKPAAPTHSEAPTSPIDLRGTPAAEVPATPPGAELGQILYPEEKPKNEVHTESQSTPKEKPESGGSTPGGITTGVEPGQHERSEPGEKPRQLLEPEKPAEAPAAPAPAAALEPKPVTFAELPEYARRAVHDDSMMRRTNEGGSIDAPDPYEGATWTHARVPLESLKPGNEVLWNGKFQHRGSMTKGPIVVNDRGEIIDGNNRAYEAIQRGDKNIEVFRAEAKPAAPAPAAAPEPAKPEAPAKDDEDEYPPAEHHKFRTGNHNKIDVYLWHEPGRGWWARGDFNLQGQASGYLGRSGFDPDAKDYGHIKAHPTREEALAAFAENATRPQNTLTAEYASDPPAVKKRRAVMIAWVKKLANAKPAPSPERVAHAEAQTAAAKSGDKNAQLWERIDQLIDQGKSSAEARAQALQEQAAEAAAPAPEKSEPKAKTEKKPKRVKSERGGTGQPDTTRGGNPGPLEPGEPGNGERTSEPGNPPENAEVQSATGEESVQPGDQPGTGGGSGEGTDQGNLDGPVTTVTRPPRPRKPTDDRPRLTGYRITPADRIGEGSLTDKAIANVEAIRLMKAIEAENRPATVEEQQKLVKYTGWGALSEVFDYYQSTAAMRQVRADLQKLLTDAEWKTVAATTPNAHYTSPAVISGIWDAVRRLGAKPGLTILEPSMGVGHFFGLMPDDLRSGAKLAGVELDPITARIAALLYPDAATYATGFERTRFPNNWFDVAVSNVPFGNYAVADREFRGARGELTRSIHNFFFAKALDKVRPGGIVAFVTSHFTMDAKDADFRSYVQSQAKFLGAIRLPNTAFEKNAGTSVLTDIVFLQKRLPGDVEPGEDFTKASPTKFFSGDEANPHQNDYFERHPEMMLGTPEGGSGRFGPELRVSGKVTPEGLAAAIARLPENVLTDRPAIEAFAPGAIAAAEYSGTLKQGAYGVVDGKLVRAAGDMLNPVDLPKETAGRVTGMIGIRDAMHEVYRTQLEDEPEAAQEKARKQLNKVYDAYVKKFGILNDPKNSRAFRDDPDSGPLLALEKYDRKTGTAKKMPVFTESTVQAYKPVESADSAKGALAISLNEYGRINWSRMAQLTGRDAEELQDELGPLVYRDPESQEWQPADQYLSGDIRQKLAQARDVAKADPSYQRNVEALEAVKPPDLRGGLDIKGRLGAPWIPAKLVEKFIGELLNVQPRHVNVSYSAALATWEVHLDNKGTIQNNKEWAGGGMPAHKLIESALNMKVPVVRVPLDENRTVVDPKATAQAQEAQQKIKARFGDWLWEEPNRRTALEKFYNDNYNGIRLRQYDGSHMTYPGMNPAIKLRAHQNNAVWRVVSSGMNTLLAHVVGAGKTFEMAAAAMELRRLGLAKKPLITAPKNVAAQFAREFQQLYPAARLFVADDDTFSAKNRQKAMAQIAAGNYDAAIITHDQFGLIPVSDETFNAFLQKEIDQLEDALREMSNSRGGKAEKRTQKELEKAKKRLEAKLRKAADEGRKDNALTFEEMGIDALFVDEADLFKNLYFTTKATRIAGIPNSESNRAFDMLIKTRHVSDKANGRLVFATGTPIANTVAEMFTMLRYLSPKELEARNIGMFDAWAQQFGDTVTGLEVSPDGAGFRTNTRFAKFQNLPELQNLFRQVADVQTAEMLNLPVPKLVGGKYETITVPASETLKNYIMGKDESGHYLPGTLLARIAAIKAKHVEPKEDNMLKVTSDGRKAALDLRLIGVPGDIADSKVNQAVNRIYEIWEAGKDKKTTQLVFSDLSTPGDKWNVYTEIRNKLQLKGVPASEIFFAHEADTDAKKAAWSEKMNAGEIRITIGSTAKMGAGTNVQRKLVALHHLDVPWRPRDVEQREGRILRQGNTNEEVHILRYVTAPSFDAYMWGMVARKAKFINSIMKGDLSVREAEDISDDALGATEAEAAATGNPLIREKAQIDNEVFRLSALQSEHSNRQFEARATLPAREQSLAHTRELLKLAEADLRARNANTPASADDWSMEIAGKKYTERTKAGEALVKAALGNRMNPESVAIGKYRGFEIFTRGKGEAKPITTPDGKTFDGNPPHLGLAGEAEEYGFNFNAESGLGTVASMDSRLRHLDRDVEFYRDERIPKLEDEVRSLRDTALRPFAEGATLDALVKRQAEIIKALDLDANQTPVGDEEGETASDPEAGFASLDFLTLGILPFVRDDVVPTLRSAARAMVETGGDIGKVLFPTLLDKNAETASLVMRGKLAELARKTDQARAALQQAYRYFERQPATENLDFMDRMETGQKQKTTELDAIAFRLRKLLDDKRADVQSLGTGKLKSFYKNYFPHIWKDRTKATNIFEAFFRRPLEGSKRFLRKRKYPTIADGIAAGLEPVSDNPVTLALLKAHEMDRYVMAHETLAEWKKLGLAKFFRGLKPPPKGWTRIDDSISTVYGVSAAGERIVRGHYYAPDGAARILNNYLSPGLRRFAAFRAIMGANNLLNTFQLGVSAFHLGFTAADTTVSKAALAWQAALRGKPIKAAKFAAQTPAAAFTTFFEGNRMLREWYKPGSQGAAIGKLADALVTAGGRARMDQMYRTEMGAKMREALRKGNVLGAAVRVPVAAVEALSGIIMDQVVPRMKLGAFADMARFHLDELGPNAKWEDVQRTLTQDWNSVENRLGEMTYDNLFWNRFAKDLAMISVRSVGWNLGTLREIGGGIGDVAVQPYRALKGEPVNLNRLSYLMGLLTVTATMGAVYQYLHTGKPPEELEDYFFPKNGATDEAGRPQRSSPPTYIKDVYHYATHPLKTLANKAAPIWSLADEMIRNKDFYGDRIRNADDPLVVQLADEAKHVAKAALPIGVRSYQRETALGSSPEIRAEQFVGMSAAPSELDKTPAERLASDLAAERSGDEPGRPAEAAERRELRQSLTRSLRMRSGVPDAVKAARASGHLSRRDIALAIRAAHETPLQRAFTALTLPDALRVYAAGSEGEKREMKPMLIKKARAALGNAAPAGRADLARRVRAALN